MAAYMISEVEARDAAAMEDDHRDDHRFEVKGAWVRNRLM
jgi:hypothetical protein